MVTTETRSRCALLSLASCQVFGKQTADPETPSAPHGSHMTPGAEPPVDSEVKDVCSLRVLLYSGFGVLLMMDMICGLLFM